MRENCSYNAPVHVVALIKTQDYQDWCYERVWYFIVSRMNLIDNTYMRVVWLDI